MASPGNDSNHHHSGGDPAGGHFAMTRQFSNGDILSADHPVFSSRFKVLRKLGEGGVAVVYQVLDQKDDRLRTLKTLKPALLRDPSVLGRFEEEFRILRRLHHPGLPEMFDYGVAQNGARYMVMEYIEGKPLNEYVCQHPEELRLLLFEITEALQFIHEFNLLHFDLKPDNILVHRTTAAGGEKPQIVLIDFGLSLNRGAGDKPTVSGTPAYMAPEIIEQNERLTRAVDYYGLGVTLFELIEGRIPFEGTMSEILRAHLYREVKFEKQLVEYTDLYPHVITLMSKDPNRRLEGFEDFRRMLAAKASGDAPALERIYGLGYIESLGMIGKQELWNNLKNWIDKTNAATKARQREQAAAEVIPEASRDSSLDNTRTLVVTGPSRSGKSFLLETFRGECLLKGMAVWMLGEGGDYESLVSENPFGRRETTSMNSMKIDPRAIIIDRFVRGWERLKTAGESGGAVLVIDGYEYAGEEEREFLEYVGKRLDLVMGEGIEPGVFIVATGQSPRLMKELKTILPKDQKMDEYMIPPPGKNDIDNILNKFHGRMTGKDDRTRLGEYLIQKSSTSGTILETLRKAIVRGELVRESGRWRFMWAAQRTRTREADKDNYYQSLLAELPEEEREILSWLCCHRGPLQVELFKLLSGTAEDKVMASFGRLKPYRLLDLARESGRDVIGIRNEAAADGLYQGVPSPKRRIIHNHYIEQYRKLLRESSMIDPKEYARLREIMAFHYSRIGDRRSALLMRIQAVRSMKYTKDIFGLRRVCEEGILEARRLKDKGWRNRKWDIERYFIRELVNAEWMVENYRGVTRVVRDNLIIRKKNIPLGVFYKYGMALRWAGEYLACRDLIKSFQNKQHKNSTQNNIYCLMIESALMNNLNKYSRSLDILNKLTKYGNVLNNNKMKSTIMVFYTLNYYNLGNNKKYISQVKILKRFAEENNLIDELLFAHYCEIDTLFNNGHYSAAKAYLKKSIQLANSIKMYFRLCNMYHLFSGIFYEEGMYTQAIKYIKKSIELSSDLGLTMWQANCQLKLSYNYERNGSWGEAIKSAKIVVTFSSKRHWKDLQFVSLLQLFNMYTLIYNHRAKYYGDRCQTMINQIESKSDLALYYYQMGNYFVTTDKHKQAIISYKHAERYYRDVKFADDALRCSLKIAYVYLINRLNNKCKQRLMIINKYLKNMESEDLFNEYLVLQMAFYYLTKTNISKLNEIATTCEKKIKDINNISVYLDMSKMLFRIFAKAGIKKKSIYYYKCYHKKMSLIINQIENSEYSQGFIESGDYSDVRKEARIIKKNRSVPKTDLS